MISSKNYFVASMILFVVGMILIISGAFSFGGAAAYRLLAGYVISLLAIGAGLMSNCTVN
jgi:ABC-type bacteriocin/lantibiotic exporter with double-glycine peptidase domain